MSNFFLLSLLLLYIIFNSINSIRAIPKGFILGATFEAGQVTDKIYKIDPLTGKSTIFSLLTGYKPYDVTYDSKNKIFYIFAGETETGRESSTLLILVNPLNGTKQYRSMSTERDAELFGLRIDSSTGKLYSLQMSGPEENPVSIVQIDPTNFVATRWVNITETDGVQPDSMAIFYNSTDHQYFVTVAAGVQGALVGIDLIKRKIISRVSNSDLPSYLCYDHRTNAFYGMESFEKKRGCRLVRLNPYNGTLEVLSKDFNNYLPSAGDCYQGYYFTMIVSPENQKVVTFDLNNNGTVISNKLGEEYLDSLAFVPI